MVRYRSFVSSLGNLCAILSFFTVPAAALELEQVMIDPEVMADECKQVENQLPVSVQAEMNYSTPNLAPDRKALQSLECSRSTGTVFYFQYSGDTDMPMALLLTKMLVWGSGEPSEEHSERIFLVDNILVVIAGTDTEAFERSIKEAADHAGPPVQSE